MDTFTAWSEMAIQWLVTLVDKFSYAGLFIIGFIEAIPIPAELMIIPAGYLVHQGDMNFTGVLIATVLGTTCGATFNYWIVRKYGRVVIQKFARFVFLNDSKLAKLEKFFVTHGPVSIFLGRLLPGVRHYLFLPAGLAHMDPKKFAIYTAFGSFLWSTVLVMIGYHVGKNQELALKILPIVTRYAIVFIIVVALIYSAVNVIRARRAKALNQQDRAL